MKCPYCGHKEDKVIDSRASSDEETIRRRRECLKCSQRFTTYEYIERASFIVIKKDNNRETFDRKKILEGVMKACEKRPISLERMEQLVDKVGQELQKKLEREISSTEIGEIVMQELAGLDDVAYVRFASVYRQFKDVNQFMKESKSILNKEK